MVGGGGGRVWSGSMTPSLSPSQEDGVANCRRWSAVAAVSQPSASSQGKGQCASHFHSSHPRASPYTAIFEQESLGAGTGLWLQ